MKKYVSILIGILFAGLLNAQDLSVKYIDSDVPGEFPKIYAEGLISTIYHEHSAPNFSPNGDEMIFTLSCDHGHTIMYTKFENGNWTVPVPISFSGKFSDDGHEWLDNNTIVFNSKRTLNGEDKISEVYRTFIIKRVGGVWGETELTKELPRSWMETNSRTRYTYLKSPENSKDWNIYKFVLINGNYSKPIPLSDNINTDNSEGTVFVSPDESYIIFGSTGHPELIGIMDLYISFKDKEGKWSKAINLGKSINKEGTVTRFPRVSRDGKFLFYYQNRENKEKTELTQQESGIQYLKPYRPENGLDGDIYWVSAKIIEKLKPKQ